MSLATVDLLLNEMYRPRRPVPIRFVSRIAHDDVLELRAIASRNNATGMALFVMDLETALTQPAGVLKRLIEPILRKAADKALTAQLMVEEMRQGWPPRECLHGDPA